MPAILTNEALQEALDSYYVRHYGVCDTDHWYPAPAANVRVFARNCQLITLNCHILTGIVREYVEGL